MRRPRIAKTALQPERGIPKTYVRFAQGVGECRIDCMNASKLAWDLIAHGSNTKPYWIAR
jgi:hypothetical protein